MEYRADIDGLRAIAVIPVVFYHVGVSGFGGGFIGVDVFFVISGYLITTIIYREIQDGTFSIMGFYQRRARRILPAFFIVLLFTFFAAYFVLVPEEFTAFSKSAIAALMFSSNFWFWLNSGDYFAGSTDFLPLLHTWSLAVEEQFYIFFPLLLIALNKWMRGGLKSAILIMTFGSLALAVYATARMPSALFYLLPTRAWELGFGAVLALGLLPNTAPRFVREVLAICGLAAILIPVFFYSSATPFPGLAALPPIVGSAFLIWVGGSGQSFISRVLSWRPLVFMGLTSYSLYLWHWPIMSLVRNYRLELNFPTSVMLGTLVLSLVAATLTWRFVEIPFRNRGKGGISNNTVLLFSVGGMVSITGIALIIVFSAGVPQRFDPTKLELRSAISPPYELVKRCSGARPVSKLCTFGDVLTPRPPTLLLWGDSHARTIMPAVETLMQGAGLTAVFANKGDCAPLPGISRSDLSEPTNEKCGSFKQSVLEYVLNAPEITTVILAGRWSLYTDGPGKVGDDRKEFALFFNNPPENTGDVPSNNPEIISAVLFDLLQELTAAGKMVVIIGPIPEIGWNVRKSLERSLVFDQEVMPDPREADVIARQLTAHGILEELAKIDGVSYLPVTPEICFETCPTHDGSRAYYSDDNHLNALGSNTFIGPILRAHFDGVPAIAPETTNATD